jgi:hypothetical protein
VAFTFDLPVSGLAFECANVWEWLVMPVKPDDLPGYVVEYYGRFMRPEEAQEYQDLILQYKRLWEELFLAFGGIPDQVSPTSQRLHLVEEAYADPRWRAYWQRRVAFFKRTSDRILKEQKVFLNRCPHCNSLARTPTAKQCGKCFKRWDTEYRSSPD